MALSFLVNSGSGNNLVPVWCQTIAWTNAVLLLIGLLRKKNLIEIWIWKKKSFFHEHQCKLEIVFEMAAILYRPHSVS